MLGIIDLVVIGVYFALTLALGFWSVRRGQRSTREFFVAEKSLPWWVVGLTMVAASISAEQMLGEVGYSKDAGLVVSNWDLGVYPSLLLMVGIFLPLYLRGGITTIPEYLEKRYGATTRLLFAVYTVFSNACITLVMVLALGAKALTYFTRSPQYEGLGPAQGAALLLVLTGAYTVYGGMTSVAWTQTLQCILLLAGGILMFAVGLSKVPGGWAGMFERMADPHLIRPVSDPYVPWPGLILLMLSTNVWYCCTNQFYVQSCLGAKDERHGRLGVLLTAFLGPMLTLCFAFPGYIARDLLQQDLLSPIPLGDQGATDANATYPHLVGQFLGPGLRGFVVAAVLGAIMSTISAIVNATASVFTNDLYRRWVRPAAADAHFIWVGRLVGLATLAVAFPLSLFAGKYNYIFVYSQNTWCILAIPIMLVFTFGALWKRATNVAATATFVVVAPFVAVPFVFGNTQDNLLDLPGCPGKVHLFNLAFVLWLAAAVFMFVASLLTRAPDAAAVEPYVWRPGRKRPSADEARPAPWYQRTGFWILAAGVMYLVIYAVYW